MESGVVGHVFVESSVVAEDASSQFLAGLAASLRFVQLDTDRAAYSKLLRKASQPESKQINVSLRIES